VVSTRSQHNGVLYYHGLPAIGSGLSDLPLAAPVAACRVVAHAREKENQTQETATEEVWKQTSPGDGGLSGQAFDMPDAPVDLWFWPHPKN
jgi:hypothetical protein